jgi:hypothetical protein
MLPPPLNLKAGKPFKPPNRLQHPLWPTVMAITMEVGGLTSQRKSREPLEGGSVAYADVQPNGYIDHFFVAAAFVRQGVGGAWPWHAPWG